MTQNKSDMTIPCSDQHPDLVSPTSLDAADSLKDRLAELREAESAGKRRLCITIPVYQIDLLAWLRSRNRLPKFYWRSRAGELEVAAVGVAREDTAHNRAQLAAMLDSHFNDAPESASMTLPASYLVAPFDVDSSNTTPTENRTLLISPQLQLIRLGRRCFLNAQFSSEASNAGRDDLESIAELLAEPVTGIPDLEISTIISRTDNPSRSRWSENVSSVLQAAQTGRVGKVVLARQTRLQLENPIDAFALLAKLRVSNRTAFAYLVQTEENAVFIGVSPERLFRLESDQLVTEAIAGTAPRGTTPEHDQRLAEELLQSQKNLSEQRFVIDAVKGAVESYCLNSSDQPITPELLKLSRVQHLISRFSGRLKESTGLGDLFCYLFPTPAVCGSPRQAALDMIRKLDGFDRGWYAGAIGVIGSNSAEFAVAIRSMYVCGKELSLFAGAGIVPGSDALLEWEELDHKLATVLAVLDGSNGSEK